MGCSTCQVIIPDQWFDKLNKMPETERDKLDKSITSTTANSRLACCIQVRPELNEMIVVIGNNYSHEGEWPGWGNNGGMH